MYLEEISLVLLIFLLKQLVAKSLLRSLNLEQPKSKCYSSSTKLSEQFLQSQDIGVFGMAYLPFQFGVYDC